MSSLIKDFLVTVNQIYSFVNKTIEFTQRDNATKGNQYFFLYS